MAAQANKRLVRRFLTEVWDAGSLAATDELVAPDYVVPGVGRGPAAVRRNVEQFRSAFPDLHVSIESLIGEGDRVAARFTLHGTHLGPFKGYVASGRRVAIVELGIWRVEHGRLAEAWFAANALEVRQAMGVLPSWDDIARRSG
jgi:steroid delta-isomerase-like uncharacterized protein